MLSGLNIPARLDLQMPLCKVFVAQIVPEERKFYSYGRFVIDTSISVSGQEEILALLADGDLRRIGVELGIIVDLGCAMPVGMRYEFDTLAVDPLDLPTTPTFTSEYGYRIWVFRDFQTHLLLP